jgi:hypothetical protein
LKSNIAPPTTFTLETLASIRKRRGHKGKQGNTWDTGIIFKAQSPKELHRRDFINEKHRRGDDFRIADKTFVTEVNGAWSTLPHDRMERLKSRAEASKLVSANNIKVRREGHGTLLSTCGKAFPIADDAKDILASLEYDGDDEAMQPICDPPNLACTPCGGSKDIPFVYPAPAHACLNGSCDILATLPSTTDAPSSSSSFSSSRGLSSLSPVDKVQAAVAALKPFESLNRGELDRPALSPNHLEAFFRRQGHFKETGMGLVEAAAKYSREAPQLTGQAHIPPVVYDVPCGAICKDKDFTPADTFALQKALLKTLSNLALRASSNGKAARAADGDTLIAFEVFTSRIPLSEHNHGSDAVIFCFLTDAMGKYHRFPQREFFQEMYEEATADGSEASEFPWTGMVLVHGRMQVVEPLDRRKVPLAFRNLGFGQLVTFTEDSLTGLILQQGRAWTKFVRVHVLEYVDIGEGMDQVRVTGISDSIGVGGEAPQRVPAAPADGGGGLFPADPDGNQSKSV